MVRKVRLAGGGELDITGRPEDDGNEVALKMVLTGQPKGVSTWPECQAAHLVADKQRFELSHVKVAQGYGGLAELNARVGVAEMIQVVKSTFSALVICGNENVFSSTSRGTVLSFFKQFKPIAVEHGTWNPGSRTPHRKRLLRRWRKPPSLSTPNKDPGTPREPGGSRRLRRPPPGSGRIVASTAPFFVNNGVARRNDGLAA